MGKKNKKTEYEESKYLEVSAEGHFAVSSLVIRESDVWRSQRDETVNGVRGVVHSTVVAAKTSKRNPGMVGALQAQVGPQVIRFGAHHAFVCFVPQAQQVLSGTDGQTLRCLWR